MQKNRLEAFSDGVIAIIITIVEVILGSIGTAQAWRLFTEAVPAGLKPLGNHGLNLASFPTERHLATFGLRQKASTDARSVNERVTLRFLRQGVVLDEVEVS